ncbi:MAG: hypothetical protein KJZ87_14800 [Thermoguttaceae bacterium]|nr:hypothetical protein [Thermoguttaceae bacterium]
MRVGFGGAGGCLAIARDPQKPVGLRIALCAVVTVACWLLVAALLGGMFFMRARRGGAQRACMLAGQFALQDTA